MKQNLLKFYRGNSLYKNVCYRNKISRITAIIDTKHSNNINELLKLPEHYNDPKRFSVKNELSEIKSIRMQTKLNGYRYPYIPITEAEKILNYNNQHKKVISILDKSNSIPSSDLISLETSQRSSEAHYDLFNLNNNNKRKSIK